MAKKNQDTGRKIVARNRRARYDYTIEDTLEAGLILEGSEVKTLRAGQGSIQEAYAGETDGEICLINAFIPEYKQASYQNHNPRRQRKLLLRRRQISKLLGALAKKGVTLVPISIYFNERGIAKLELGIATGKKKYEKRDAEKDRDWQRQKERIMRHKE